MSNSTINILETLLDKAKKYGADAADALYVDAQSQSIQIREQKLENAEHAQSATLGLRVLCGSKQATYSAADTGNLDLDSIAQNLVKHAKILPDDPFATIAKQTGTYLTNDLDLFDDTINAPQDMRSEALHVEEIALAHDGIKQSLGASSGFSHMQVHLANSYGFMGAYKRSSFAKSISVLAEDDGEMVRDYAYDQRTYYNQLKGNQALGDEAAVRTLQQRSPIIPATGRSTIVFEPRVARSFVAKLVSAINGQSITQKSSFLIHKLQEQILPRHFSLIDDPLLPQGKASRPFDDEGMLSQKNCFIDQGILKNWILDTRTALELGLQSTANAARSASSLPYPASSNIALIGGEIPLKEFLKQYGGGIYITSTMGMGINLLTGDYSQGASGLMINKDGSFGEAIHNFTIAGNLSDMLMQLEAADDLDRGFTIAAPTLMVGEMTIAGRT